MPEMPFAVTGQTIEEIKAQVNELIRTLYEDRIGGYDRTILDPNKLLALDSSKDVVSSEVGSSPTFVGLTLSGLTASRLVSTSALKALESTDADSWVSGTTNEIEVADDGDGSITLSLATDLQMTDLEGLIFYAGKR